MAAIIEYEQVLIDHMVNIFLGFDYRDSLTEKEIYENTYNSLNNKEFCSTTKMLVIPFVTKFSAQPEPSKSSPFVCTPENAKELDLDIMSENNKNKHGDIEVNFPYVIVEQGKTKELIYFRNMKKAQRFCEVLKEEIEDYYSNPNKYIIQA